MHTFSAAEIKQMTEDVQTGLVVYVHKRSGEVTSVPDFDRFGVYDTGEWDKDLRFIDTNYRSLIEFKYFSERESERLAGDFAGSLDAKPDGEKLKNSLSLPAGLKKFENQIRNLRLDKEWKAYIFEHLKFDFCKQLRSAGFSVQSK